MDGQNVSDKIRYSTNFDCQTKLARSVFCKVSFLIFVRNGFKSPREYFSKTLKTKPENKRFFRTLSLSLMKVCVRLPHESLRPSHQTGFLAGLILP